MFLQSAKARKLLEQETSKAGLSLKYIPGTKRISGTTPNSKRFILQTASPIERPTLFIPTPTLIVMPSLPGVLIITGDVDISEVWEELLASLKATSNVTSSADAVVSSQLLLSGDVSSVLVVSPQPFLSTEKPYRVLRDHVRTFAEQQGGTVLFCGTFSSVINRISFDSYFGTEWKLPWRFGEYHRTTFALNPHFHLNCADGTTTSTFDPMTAGLDSAYSQKAVQVKGAPKNARLYTTTSESRLESSVWSAMPMHDETQSPVVFESYGKGRVGFAGDANAETGTTKAILALCGLTSNTTPPVVIAGTSNPNAGGLYCSGCGKQARTADQNKGEGYKRCSRCQACYYCSMSCQKAHWEAGHKKDCKYMGINDDY